MDSSTATPVVKVAIGALEDVADPALAVGVFEGDQPFTSRVRARRSRP